MPLPERPLPDTSDDDASLPGLPVGFGVSALVMAGVIVLAFGILGLLRAAEIGGMGIARGWIDVFCITPGHGA